MKPITPEVAQAITQCVEQLRASGTGPLTCADYLVRVATGIVIIVTRDDPNYPIEYFVRLLHQAIDETIANNDIELVDIKGVH